MKILVKFTRVVDGKTYEKGEHVLKDALAQHWYVKAMLADGVFEMIEPPAAKKEEILEIAPPLPQPQHKKRR